MLLANVPVSQNVRHMAQRAFNRTCEELAIGVLSLDVPKRERVAQVVERLVRKGERDPLVLQRRAVSHFKYCEPDAIA
jgi:hypothetical protein